MVEDPDVTDLEPGDVAESEPSLLKDLSDSELEKLAKEDIAFYRDLSPEDRRKVDRIAAVSTTRAEYEANPDLYEYDMQYLKTLDKTERQIVKRLAADLMSSPDNPKITEEEKNYYQHMSPEKRNKINRLVVVEALKAESAADVKLASESSGYYSKLQPEEKGRIDRITRMRRASNRIIGSDLEADLMAAGQSNIMAVVNTFKAGEYDNVSVSAKLYHIYTGQPAFGVEIPLLDTNGEVVKITTTNESGELRYANLPSGAEFRILVGQQNAEITEPPKYFIKDLKVEGIRSADLTIVNYDNIYFDINSDDLRPEATKILDELARLVREQPTVQIEINAYTDNTGSDEYNIALSQKRGNAAFEYLVAKGADRTSIVINPRGKSDPIASNQSAFGRQFNRRVEFGLTGKSVSMDLEYMTYITKPGATYAALAAALDWPESRLRQINGVNQNDELTAYQPVRISASADPDESLLFERNATNNQFFYTVKRGDTVFSLARLFGMPEELLMETNGLKGPSDLKAGQVLTIYRLGGE
jgi:outer membrane protein OmpA-like peptidoglycan-associated protein